MNSRKKRLIFIRYKNGMKKKGYKPPKWTTKNKCYPYMWINTSPSLFEESWVWDLGFS
jgi:hypothetical protein